MLRTDDRLDSDLRGPRGDPAVIRAAAVRFDQVTCRALATAGVRGDAAADLSRVWSGPAASDAGRELAVLSGRARHVLPQVAEAGAALWRYADALEEKIARTTALRARADAARHDHARLVAAALATTVDASVSAATVTQADLRLAETLTEIHRAHQRALDDFLTAGAACARTLSGLAETAWLVGTGAAGRPSGPAPGPAAPQGRGMAGLLDGLPLVELQIRTAAAPPAPDAAPDEDSWGQAVLDAVGEAAVWTYNHTAVPAVNAAADLAQAVVEHPEDLLEMAVGAGMIVIGGGVQVGGVALDATGVGVVAGVPLHVAAAGLMATGAGAAAHGATGLLDHASRNDNRLLREIDGPYPDRGGPGDPLPDFLRPDGAGSSWKGRVSDNGKGEVWQHPDRIGNPSNHKDADSMRYMDPTDRFPNGYVRFSSSTGQTLTLDGHTGPNPVTHHPIKEDFTYDIPKGWRP